MQQQMWFISELQKTKINVILVFKAYNIAITNKNVSKLHFLFWLFTALCEEDTKLYCNWIRSRTRKWDAREDSKKPKELGVLVVRQISSQPKQLSSGSFCSRVTGTSSHWSPATNTSLRDLIKFVSFIMIKWIFHF